MQTNVSGGDGRIYLIVLDDAPHGRVARAARQGARRASSSSTTSAPTTWRPSSTPAAAQRRARTSPTASGVLLRRSTSSWAASSTRRRSSRIDDVQMRAPASASRAIGSRQGHGRPGTRSSTRAPRSTRCGTSRTYLGGVRGRRKAMLFISEGIDYDIYDVMSEQPAGRIDQSVMDADAGRRSPPRRAPTSPSTASTRAASAPASTTSSSVQYVSRRHRRSDLGTSRPSQRARASRRTACACSARRPAASPRSTRNDFSAALRALVDDNSSYYLLGYYSTNERRDGRFRKIEVKVNAAGADGARAQRLRGAARPGAEAERRRQDRAPELREALTSPLPAGCRWRCRRRRSRAPTPKARSCCRR